MRNPMPKQNRHQQCRLISGLSNISTTVRMRQGLVLNLNNKLDLKDTQNPFGSHSFSFNSHIEYLTSWAGYGVVGQNQQEEYPHPQAPGWSCPQGTWQWSAHASLCPKLTHLEAKCKTVWRSEPRDDLLSLLPLRLLLCFTNEGDLPKCTWQPQPQQSLPW